MHASKDNKVGSTVISGYTHNVNHRGQRTGVSTAGTALAASGSIDWGYNSNGEVVMADSSVDTADCAYQYDGICNRLQGSAGVSPAYDDGNATAYPLPANPGANNTLVWDA